MLLTVFIIFNDKLRFLKRKNKVKDENEISELKKKLKRFNFAPITDCRYL